MRCARRVVGDTPRFVDKMPLNFWYAGHLHRALPEARIVCLLRHPLAKSPASEFIGEGPFATKPVKGSGFLGLATDARPEGGLRVTKVGNKTPAEAAGVKEGDVLMKLNGTPLTSGYISIQAETHPTEFRKIELLQIGRAHV